MKKLIKEPLLHFLAIGALLFAVNAWRSSKRPAEVNGPRIEVTAATIGRLCAGYERQFGQGPDAAELRGLVTAHVREEVLCREALALGLDRDDSIVRRRLAQKMEFLTDDVTSAAPPEEAAVERYFAEHAAVYAKPGQVSFRHVYFSKEKRGAKAGTEAAECLAALARGASDEAMGDAFLYGFNFAEREKNDVTALFGQDFAKQLAVLPAGAWQGPVESSFGLHLVRVDARSEAAPAKLSEVRAAVERDLNDERRVTANREIYEKLRERYEVAVDEAALAKSAVSKTAQR
ncbi:peptidylprolyl isomerase [Haloferula sp. BvORR071]|uniref:peptidylprolyl isomerase n=1 Tax=Haloferula sp. BvORR071 TaxID=1396141 RepID=UPI000695BD25|nr:peptidylprolyl isomerase [Haloferula sp. BvORR071]